jgi:hypothetical protein
LDKKSLTVKTISTMAKHVGDLNQYVNQRVDLKDHDNDK